MKTFNKASFAFALSTSNLLAGCGSSTAPQEKTAYLVKKKKKLLLRIVPSCNKEGVGMMQFDRLIYAEHWAEKYASEITVTSVQIRRGEPGGLYKGRTPDGSQVAYRCKEKIKP